MAQQNLSSDDEELNRLAQNEPNDYGTVTDDGRFISPIFGVANSSAPVANITAPSVPAPSSQQSQAYTGPEVSREQVAAFIRSKNTHLFPNDATDDEVISYVEHKNPGYLKSLGYDDVASRAKEVAQEQGADENLGLQLAAPFRALSGGLHVINGQLNGGNPDGPMPSGGLLGRANAGLSLMPQTPNQVALTIGAEGLSGGLSELGNAIRESPEAVKALSKAEYLRSGSSPQDVVKVLKDPGIPSRAVSPGTAGQVYGDSLGQLGLKGGTEATLDAADANGVASEASAGKLNRMVTRVNENVKNADNLKLDAMQAHQDMISHSTAIQTHEALADLYNQQADAWSTIDTPEAQEQSLKLAQQAHGLTESANKLKAELPDKVQAYMDAHEKIPTAQDAITSSQWLKSQTSAPREFPTPQGTQSRIAKKLPISYSTIKRLDDYASKSINEMGGFPNPVDLPGYGPIKNYDQLRQVYSDALTNSKLGKILPVTKTGSPSITRALVAGGLFGGGAMAGRSDRGAAGALGAMALQSPLAGREALRLAYNAPGFTEGAGPLLNALMNLKRDQSQIK